MNTHILDKARELARERGLNAVTLRALCNMLKIPVGSFQHRAGGTLGQLKNHLLADDEYYPLGPISSGRADPEARQKAILDAALYIAEHEGLYSVTAATVAEAAMVSRALVHRYWQPGDLRKDVISEATRRDITPVLAQALANGEVHASSLSATQLNAVAKYVTGGRICK